MEPTVLDSEAAVMVSTSRPVLDSLFNLYLAIGAVVTLIVLGALAYAIIRYRHRPGQAEPTDAPRLGVIPPQRGSAKSAIIMTIIVAVLLFPLSVGTFKTVDFIEHPPAEEALEIKVVGMRFSWTFEYPEGFKSTGELVVPVDRVVILEVTSRDVFHSFDIPDFRIKADAIPGHVNHIWFKATKPGTYNAFCAELCGVGHAVMKAKVVVMTPEDFESWRAKRAGGRR